MIFERDLKARRPTLTLLLSISMLPTAVLRRDLKVRSSTDPYRTGGPESLEDRRPNLAAEGD
jgi:hypothetical protein